VDGPDRFQRRHVWLGFPVAVVYKFFDDFGTYLSAIITYYAFLSLFPLLLIASTVLSVVLRGNQHLQHELLTSALKSIPVINQELDQPEHLSGGAAGPVAMGLRKKLVDIQYGRATDPHDWIRKVL